MLDWKKFSPWCRGLSFDGVTVIIFATVALILFHENGSSSVFRLHLAPFFSTGRFSGLYPAFYWYGCSLVMLGVIPYIFGRLVLGLPAGQMGEGRGDWKFGLKAVIGLYLTFLPLLVAVSFMPEFKNRYPLFYEARESVWHLLLYELAYAVYFMGWEFIFRGFMLFGLLRELGFWAVLVQTIPFAIMHFGKAQLETLAAVPAGIILGYLALRTRSFWYGWLLHTAIAVSNDLLALWHGR
jgi:membrane protease YdiL (CAAX protease family)